MATNPHLALLSSADEFAAVESEWNRLALSASNPFLTHQWLLAWWRAFAEEAGLGVLLNGADGTPVAGAVLRRRSPRVVASATNAYGEQWDVVAADPAARRSIWVELSRLAADKLVLGGLPADSASIEPATRALADARYRLAMVEWQQSPFLDLPGTWDELLAAQPRGHRSEIRRRRKRLEERGNLTVRTIQGLDLDADLDRFLRLEASGWKGREGTAVLQDPAARRLYTGFAHAAAAAGWLRLRFLELDGATLAADFSCVLGRSEFLLKTCFDEDSSQLGPGVVLRAAVLRSAIDDGLARYEFLGGPERYKVRWGGELRRITGVLAYRRTRLPEYLYFHKLRVGVARLIARRRTGEPSQDQ